MQPVLTVAEMAEVDALARRSVAVEALIERAGRAVAREARRMLGGTYGRRVVVVAGKGHNGDDGRVAAHRLTAAGARVLLVDAREAPRSLPPCDLVVDAAYGTGFAGEYRAPVASAPVLAVDIPSGVMGDTGEASPEAVRADVTVTFVALKPGLLLGEGRARAGQVRVADIGLDASDATAHRLEDADLAALPTRPPEAHKWQTALAVVAGSPGMMGAARLCSRAAMRAGAGMVRLGVPGAEGRDLPAGEVVAQPLPAARWERTVLDALKRCRALAVGPGLGRSEEALDAVRAVVTAAERPVVVDADGLAALGERAAAAAVLAPRPLPAVVTPHEGEYAVLARSPVGPQRLADVRRLARDLGAVVLLKGSTTVISDPGGAAFFVTAGGPRLATAGTGDVLTGILGAFLARGVPPLLAAGLAAHAHGSAAALGPAEGLVAGDLLDLLPRYLSAAGGG
ncbi:MAG TPA: NAD(P)H-hydrate dehydratase [Acidimicrobiales bacterium]